MTVPIRAITVGIGDRHPLGEEAFARAAEVLAAASVRARQAGYDPQTTRIALQPVLAGLAAASDAELIDYAEHLQQYCQRYGIGYCSLGPAPADDPAFPLDRIALVPRLLQDRPALSASVQLATVSNGVRYAAARPAAQVILDLAHRGTGDDNFRFAALALCEPGGPFFPQAYAAGPEWTVSVGLQSASVVRDAIAEVAAARNGADVIGRIPSAVRDALEAAASPVVALARDLAALHGLRFSGIDLSPAPMGDDSIVDAFEAAELGAFGVSGTLALAAAITRGIKSVPLPHCGYSGLMLPVLEDATLGERAAEGLVGVTELLTYSAVCGTGLDTVPLPGDVPVERVAALLCDVASLAYRLGKPLSARLFPVPGADAGDVTPFASPYLTNTRVLSLQ